MDIYNYLNSKDVAKHCRELNYQFNSLETAFIINNCHRISMKEKHIAFRELMESMPDIQLPKKLSYRLDDLGLFYNLKEKIRAEEELLNPIINDKSQLIFRYTTYNTISKHERVSDKLFSSYEKAKAAALEDIEDEVIIIHVMEVDTSKHIRLFLNRANEIGEIDSIDEQFDDVTCFLDDVWVYIPTPFKKGDLLCLPITDIALSVIWSNIPMVLTSIDYWKRDEERIAKRKETADSTDMIAYGFWMDSKGGIYYECCHEYHNLEYYRGELKIKDKFGRVFDDYRLLKAISAYMRGKINEDMLLVANNLIRAENNMQHSFPGWDYDEEWYKEAGIHDIFEKRKIIREFEKENK